MTDRTAELLPCPFCGGEAETIGDDYMEWIVECVECCASSMAFATEAEAIAAWNARAERTRRIIEREAFMRGRASLDNEFAEYTDEIAELTAERDELLRCLENDWNISASWDGLRRFWNIELTEEGVRLRDELNARAERTCECVAEYAKSPIDGKTIVLHRCSACHELMRPHMAYCPNCGAKVIGG